MQEFKIFSYLICRNKYIFEINIFLDIYNLYSYFLIINFLGFNVMQGFKCFELKLDVK